RLDPGEVMRPVPGEGHPHMPAQLDEEELADWRAGRAAVYQLAALTIGARIASPRPEPDTAKGNPGGGTPGFRGRPDVERVLHANEETALNPDPFDGVFHQSRIPVYC